MSERRKIIYCIAAIAGSQWLWLVNTIRCGDPNRYQYGLNDILCAVLFVIIAWSAPAVVELIRKAVKKEW
jgi:hypothetical protein